MDENRVSETVRNVGGKAEEGLGRATGDLKHARAQSPSGGMMSLAGRWMR